MNSYQRLKLRNEELKITISSLERTVNLFKKALTIIQGEPKMVKQEDNQYHWEIGYNIYRNKIDEEAKQELTKWVAFNIDKDSIMELLRIKEKLENEQK